MKNALSVIVVLLVLLTPLSVLAAPYSYYVDYENNGGFKIIFRSFSGSSRGLDSGDAVSYSLPFGSSDIGLMIYKQASIDGWDSNPARCVMDSRPLLQAGEKEVINNIYLWAGTAVTSKPLQLMYNTYNAQFSPGVTYKLHLVSIPTGVTYNGPTEWGAGHETITLPFFATNDFTKGYKFQATITAPVPEPSSLLALAGGLAGLGGFVLKRRR